MNISDFKVFCLWKETDVARHTKLRKELVSLSQCTEFAVLNVYSTDLRRITSYSMVNLNKYRKFPVRTGKMFCTPGITFCARSKKRHVLSPHPILLIRPLSVVEKIAFLQLPPNLVALSYRIPALDSFINRTPSLRQRVMTCQSTIINSVLLTIKITFLQPHHSVPAPHK